MEAGWPRPDVRELLLMSHDVKELVAVLRAVSSIGGNHLAIRHANDLECGGKVVG